MKDCKVCGPLLHCICEPQDKELPAGCDKCTSTFPCEETCGGDPFATPPQPKPAGERLEPCPFCGSEGRVYAPESEDIEWAACCSNNDCIMHPWETFLTKQEATKAWNTRTPSDHTENPKRRLEEATRINEPWPTKDIIAKLVEAANILMDDANYDGYGWEEIKAAIGAAQDFLKTAKQGDQR